ncbi:hypothetical protein GCM10027053_03410 [Intrasporangium mesophilum]
MILVPRQLQRVGITGDVPYYGGRFTAEQAYAAAHPYTGGPGPRATPRFGARPRPPAPPASPPGQPPLSSLPPPSGPPVSAARTSPAPDALASLQHLLDAGVITQDEFVQLRNRVRG